MSKKNDDLKNIVVVGGGFAGFNLAKALSSKLDASRYNLILVTSHPYMVQLVAAARMTASAADKLEDTALIPYDKLFINNNGTHKVGTVVAIEETSPGKGGSVVLQSGERINYHVLALATGSIWSSHLNFPSSDADIKGHLQSWRDRFSKAKEIVIVGGGAVGIETAGEIRDVYPSTKITLIHAGKLLLNDTYPDKFRKNIEKRLLNHNVDIVLGEYVDEIPESGTGSVTTRSGKQYSGDVIVATLGPRPNTGYVSTLDSSLLTGSGNVKVLPTLQVVNHPGVYALGDIIDWKEQKQAGKTGGHAAVVAANILSYLDGQPEKKVYKGSFAEMIVIPIGKNDGAGYLDVLWGIQLGAWLTGLMKGKTLFVPMTRSQMGL